MHLVDCFEPTVSHMQSWTHLPDDFERLSCGFKPFTLVGRGAWLDHRLGTHVAIWVHPRKVDTIHSNKGNRVNGKSDDGRLNERVPLLTGTHEVHEVSSGFEALTSAVFPVARRDVVLRWREQWWVQWAFRLLATQRDERHIFSMQHDLAKKVYRVDQGVWRRFVYCDVRLDVLWREQIVARETGFKILA